MVKKIKILTFLLLFGCNYLFAQTGKITGVVTDNTGEALPGVTVVKIGSNSGTTTDVDGKFVFNANQGDSLSFSFIGYKTTKVKLGNSSSLKIVLNPSTETIGEVIVVGYGVQKKESVVGAIVQTTGADIERAGGQTSLVNALTGLLPGVTTIQNSGEPGKDEAEIYIRGKSTWNGGAPLTLVDGVELSINDIDPSEVQSISVLKDASATAVFGVKGANGVILVTTKKGKNGKPKLSVSANTTIKTLSRIPSYLGSYDALKLKNDAIEYETMASDRYWNFYMPEQILNHYKTQDYPYLYPDVNWADWMVEKYATSNKVNLNVSGGTDFVKYFASLAYTHEGDILKTHDYGQGYDPDYQYNRFNFRTNLDFQLTKTTQFSASLSGYHGMKQDVKETASTSFWQGVYGTSPDLFPVQYPDGAFGFSMVKRDVPNPVAEMNFGGLERVNETQIVTDFDLKQDLNFITKGLSVNGKFSYTNVSTTKGPDLADGGIWTKYIDPKILEAKNAADSAAAISIAPPYQALGDQSGFDYVRQPIAITAEKIDSSKTDRRTMYQASLNYARSFGIHDITALALFKRSQSAIGKAFTSYQEDWVGRATYNYDKRYFADFNCAYNGSEKFASKYRYGFFPSVALGWMVSNEPFFKRNVKFVNQFKIRYSDGTSGSDDGVDRWLYLNSWSKTGNTASFGYPAFTTGPKYWTEGNIAVPDAHWETARKKNLGADIKLFKDLLSVTFEYFNEHRTDMFIKGADRSMPPWFGALPVAANLGETKTHGWEIDAEISKKLSNGLNYWVRTNYNFAKDEVIYKEDPELKAAYQKVAGFQIDQTKTIITEGMMNNWNDVYTSILGDVNTYTLPGTFRYIDYNSDGVVNQDDAAPYAYPSRPQYSYDLSMGLSYKGFSAMVQFYGVYNVTRSIKMSEFASGLSVARPFHQTESWTPERAGSATYPHVRYQAEAAYGSYWYKDASYLRLKTAEIAYTFSNKGFKKVGVESIKIFANGNDLFLWTKMLEDREGGSYDQTNYPMVKRYNFGININF